MKVLVLGGGTSPEREVSIESAAAVRGALADLGHTVSYVDPADGDEAVSQAATQVDLVMPVLHGPGDEDGVQEILEQAGTPYLGAGPQAARLCMDKGRYKEALLKHGVPLARGEVVTAATFSKSPLVKQPFVLKPVDDGSSVGLLVARTIPYDKTKADQLLKRFKRMLLEEFVEGVEITVAMLGDEALPVIEIVPPPGKEFDYENKYNGATAELCPPQHVSPAAQKAAQEWARRINKLVGVRHLSRTDMIVRSDDSLVVLETNTLPGMTATSLYPKAAAAAGMSFQQLVARLVELTLAK